MIMSAPQITISIIHLFLQGFVLELNSYIIQAAEGYKDWELMLKSV